jgi:hypothetical protein
LEEPIVVSDDLSRIAFTLENRVAGPGVTSGGCDDRAIP